MMPAARPTGLRVVSFDAGGTLLHPYPSVGIVYREIALNHGIDRAAEDLDRAFRDAFIHVSKDASVLDPEARERDFWWRVVQRTFATEDGEQMPASALAVMFTELWDAFAHGSRWRVYPTAVTTLAALRGAGLKLAVISNWDRRLHTVLEETGLRRFFDAVIVSSEVGVEKPDAGIFRAAEKAIGGEPNHFLHVGDSRRHDIEGAQSVGWRALLVRNDGGKAIDGEIGCLGQLVELLATEKQGSGGRAAPPESK